MGLKVGSVHQQAVTVAAREDGPAVQEPQLDQECAPRDRPADVLGVYAIYPQGRFPQPKLRAFVDFLVEHFRGRGPDNWA